MRRQGRRWRAAFVAVLLPSVVLTPAVTRLVPAAAAPLPPGFADTTTRDADLDRIVRALETRLVAAHLHRLGIDRATAEARLARLDDARLRELAQALPEVALGGQEMDWERTLGTILIFILALALVGGLIYFAVSGAGF